MANQRDLIILKSSLQFDEVIELVMTNVMKSDATTYRPSFT